MRHSATTAAPAFPHSTLAELFANGLMAKFSLGRGRTRLKGCEKTVCGRYRTNYPHNMDYIQSEAVVLATAPIRAACEERCRCVAFPCNLDRRYHLSTGKTRRVRWRPIAIGDALPTIPPGVPVRHPQSQDWMLAASPGATTPNALPNPACAPDQDRPDTHRGVGRPEWRLLTAPAVTA